MGEGALRPDITTVDIDNATGEATVRESAPLRPFVMLFQDILLKRSDDPTFTKEALRALDYVLGTMKMGNYSVVINQQELAVRWKTSRPSVCRGFNELKRRNVLIKGHRAGRGTIYTFNPHWGWKGQGKDNPQACIAAPLPLFGKISSLEEKRKKNGE